MLTLLLSPKNEICSVQLGNHVQRRGTLLNKLNHSGFNGLDWISLFSNWPIDRQVIDKFIYIFGNMCRKNSLTWHVEVIRALTGELNDAEVDFLLFLWAEVILLSSFSLSLHCVSKWGREPNLFWKPWQCCPWYVFFTSYLPVIFYVTHTQDIKWW